MMKNAFYFHLKARFLLQIIENSSRLFDYVVWKRLDKVTIQILAETSRSKDNQKMKFVQFIEYNMRKIFIEKLYINEMEKLFPDAFLKNQNLAYLWMNSLKI